MSVYHIGFLMEQTMGHPSFHGVLEREVAGDVTVRPTWIPLPPWAEDRWSRIPGIRGNMSMLLSLRARDRVRERGLESKFDALFYHTQSTALFSPAVARHLPVVISLDATPANMDSIGSGYGHHVNGTFLERLKTRWYTRIFRKAAALTTWSRWAGESLVRDYGIDPRRIAVIPPGVTLPAQQTPRLDDNTPDRRVRVLFVGAAFGRKGGEVLLQAYRSGLAGLCELDIVTRDQIDAEADGVRVHVGLNPGERELERLFAEADIFVLPSLGDCLPLAVLEAMAHGLPVVTTNVAAIDEAVEAGRTGLLCPPGDVASLSHALATLIRDRARRREMGIAARMRAERLFDARANCGRLIGLIKDCVDRRDEARPGPAPRTLTDRIANEYATSHGPGGADPTDGSLTGTPPPRQAGRAQPAREGLPHFQET